MNLNITLIKKFNFDIYALYIFYLWKVSSGIFAKGFSYDDSHEVLVTRVDTVYDFFAFADHHFLYSLILYLTSFLIPFANLQIINLVFVLTILFFTKKLYEILSLSYISFLLSTLILLSSPIFLDYSIRIKQYTLDYLLVLLTIYIFAKLESSEITFRQFQVFGLLVSVSSLILLPIFIIFFILSFKSNFKELNIKVFIIGGLLAYFFYNIGVVRLKIFDEKYIDYFSFSFMLDGSMVEELINLAFALLIFFRGISDNGFIIFYLVIFIIGLLKSYKSGKKIVETFVILLIIFSFLHLFDFYPISAGRNMIFIFPFVVILTSQVVNISKKEKFSVFIFLVSGALLISFEKVNYPNSYISYFVDNVSDEELTLVDYYLIPQYSLYSNDTFTNIQRSSQATDRCLYSSNKNNIIFLIDRNCSPLAIEINFNKKINSYKRIVFLSEENENNTKEEVNQIFKDLNFSVVSEDKMGKTYKLIYEK